MKNKKLVSYDVSFGATSAWHYTFELSREQNKEMIIKNTEN
jgi:hypothetical protein